MKDFRDFRQAVWFMVFLASSFMGLLALYLKMPIATEWLALAGSGLLLILAGRELAKLKVFWLSLGMTLLCILFTSGSMYLSLLVTLGFLVSFKKFNEELKVDLVNN